jgi:hypothetical protein
MLPLHHTPSRMLRRGIEPLRSLGPAVLQTTAFPFGHLSAHITYRVFKQQRAKTAPNLNTVSESGSAPKSLYGKFLRFGSGRTAPAESLHLLAIIGEPSFSRFHVP